MAGTKRFDQGDAYGHTETPVCHVAEGVHIPGCYGCAVYGHRRCTCERVRP